MNMSESSMWSSVQNELSDDDPDEDCDEDSDDEEEILLWLLDRLELLSLDELDD